MFDKEIAAHREFLKDSLRLNIDFSKTDQHNGVKTPPLQKALRNDQTPMTLPGRESLSTFRGTDLVDAIRLRRSYRRYHCIVLLIRDK